MRGRCKEAPSNAASASVDARASSAEADNADARMGAKDPTAIPLATSSLHLRLHVRHRAVVGLLHGALEDGEHERKVERPFRHRHVSLHMGPAGGGAERELVMENGVRVLG